MKLLDLFRLATTLTVVLFLAHAQSTLAQDGKGPTSRRVPIRPSESPVIIESSNSRSGAAAVYQPGDIRTSREGAKEKCSFSYVEPNFSIKKIEKTVDFGPGKPPCRTVLVGELEKSGILSSEKVIVGKVPKGRPYTGNVVRVLPKLSELERNLIANEKEASEKIYKEMGKREMTGGKITACSVEFSTPRGPFNAKINSEQTSFNEEYCRKRLISKIFNHLLDEKLKKYAVVPKTARAMLLDCMPAQARAAYGGGCMFQVFQNSEKNEKLTGFCKGRCPGKEISGSDLYSSNCTLVKH